MWTLCLAAVSCPVQSEHLWCPAETCTQAEHVTNYLDLNCITLQLHEFTESDKVPTSESNKLCMTLQVHSCKTQQSCTACNDERSSCKLQLHALLVITDYIASSQSIVISVVLYGGKLGLYLTAIFALFVYFLDLFGNCSGVCLVRQR